MNAVRTCSTLLAISTLAIAADAAQPADDARPSSARRVAAAYDFEEPRNPEAMPADWFRFQSTLARRIDGFPGHNDARFDRSDAYSGNRCVVLPAGSGSTILRLSRQSIPVFPDADYHLTAMVKTEGLTHARAFLVGRFLDNEGAPIPGSEVRSEPIAASDWTPAGVELNGQFDNAEWLQVDLQLLQPRQFETGTQRDDRIWMQDFDVAARFDDVFVYHKPRIELTAAAESGIFIDEPPRLRAIVRDLVGESLHAQITLHDIDGNPLVTFSAPVDVTGDAIQWTPELPRYGWYHATLDVLNGGERVGHTFSNFLWLPGQVDDRASDAGADLYRFGVIADRIIPDDLPAVADLISDSDTRFLHIAAWQSDDDIATFADRVADRKPLIDRFLQEGMDVTMTLPELPDEFAGVAIMSLDNPYQLIAMGEIAWKPLLSPLLDRLGQRVRRWQVGRAGTEFAAADPDFEPSAREFNDVLGRMVPNALVSYPWSADTEPPAPDSNARALTVTYPPQFPPESFASYREGALPAADHPGEPTFVLGLPDATIVGRRARLIDMARRAVEAWASIGHERTDEPARLALDHPWLDMPDQRRRFLPEPELGAWRTITGGLAGRHVLARMPSPVGLRCYLLAAENPGTGELSRGSLIGWNEALAPEDAYIEHYLGDQPLTRIDLFGNAKPIETSPGNATRIAFGPTPEFIEGVDPRIARFIAGYRVEPARVPPVRQEHTGAVVMVNPWTTPISGRLKLTNPGSGARAWQMNPAGTIDFTIQPRQTHRIPFSFSFGPAEESGPKPLDAMVRLVAESKLPPIKLTSTIELALDDLELIPDYLVLQTPDGDHVVVVATIINSGDRARSLVIQVRPPSRGDVPSQRLAVSNLGPGQTVRKRFLFRDAADKLADQRIRIVVEDPDALAYILKSVVVR